MLGNQIPALAGFPVDWRINPLKLACLLRCADAGHIDSGRAPDYLLKLLDINGVSRNHWEAQNKLSQIDIDTTNKSNVIIASNIAFRNLIMQHGMLFTMLLWFLTMSLFNPMKF